MVISNGLHDNKQDANKRPKIGENAEKYASNARKMAENRWNENRSRSIARTLLSTAGSARKKPKKNPAARAGQEK
ncbi:MAG: hypothetical protein AB1437_20360 [Pseudomonadota bacterium]